jgi:hypothetical protein
MNDLSPRPNFYMTISGRDEIPVVRWGRGQDRRSKGRTGRSSLTLSQNPTSRVWCVTVPSGVVVVRRRGFSMLCGNCAISYIARTTYGVSGAVPVDEVNGGLALPGDGGVIDTTAADAPPALPEGLSMLVARAYAVDPRSWRPNEVLARLPEPSDRGFDAAVKKVMAELEAWLAENEPQDAVVVEDAPRFRDRNGDGTVDVAAELQHRWDVDPDWRAKVNPLLRRYVDAEAGLEEAIADDRGEDAASLRETLAEVAQELLALGVPEGWLPETAGQS